MIRPSSRLVFFWRDVQGTGRSERSAPKKDAGDLASVTNVNACRAAKLRDGLMTHYASRMYLNF